MFEKLRLLKSTHNGTMSPKLLKAVDGLLNYEKHAQKIINEKLSEDYQHIAKHALNVSSLAVGFIPGSHILDYIKKIQDATLIEKKRKEQKEIVTDPEKTETVQELRESIEEAQRELKIYKKSQIEKKKATIFEKEMESDLELLIKNAHNEEINEIEILQAMVSDINKHELLIVKELSRLNPSKKRTREYQLSEQDTLRKASSTTEKYYKLIPENVHESITLIDSLIKEDINIFQSMKEIIITTLSNEKENTNNEKLGVLLKFLIVKKNYIVDENQKKNLTNLGNTYIENNSKVIAGLIDFYYYCKISVDLLNYSLNLIVTNHSEDKNIDALNKIAKVYNVINSGHDDIITTMKDRLNKNYNNEQISLRESLHYFWHSILKLYPEVFVLNTFFKYIEEAEQLRTNILKKAA